MEEIIKLVAQKAGISQSVAQIAVTTALSALKDKLPGNIGGLLDSFTGLEADTATETVSKSKITKTSRKTKNSSDTLGTIGNIISGLSKVFGRK